MKISAKIETCLNSHKVMVQTNNAVQELAIPGKPSGYASAEVLTAFIKYTHTVADVQNTLRAGVKVKLLSL